MTIARSGLAMVGLALAILLIPWAAGSGQELPALPPGGEHGGTNRQTLNPAAGVKIDIAVDGKALSPEELARLLEEAAQKLRNPPAPVAQNLPAPQQLPANPRAPANDVLALPAIVAEHPCDWTTRPQNVLPSSAWECIGLPMTLLYTPPLANQSEPRTYVMPTSLSNANTTRTVDTAIGGEFGVVRFARGTSPDDGVQLDFFAQVFSRFADFREEVAINYRFGLPITFAWGAWSGKVSVLDHTSTHLGDEFIRATGQQHSNSQRNEATAGLAYTFANRLRIYGQGGYAYVDSTPTGNTKPFRFDCGFEWVQRQATGFKGCPFAAVDLDFRGDENYAANFTAQVGWAWRFIDYGHMARIVLQYYNGQSPYGQFIAEREKWYGVGLFYDF